jgi:hypothetical protein
LTNLLIIAKIILKIDKNIAISNKYAGEDTMSTTKNVRLARFLKVLIDLLFGALVIACIGLVIWVVVSPLIFRQAGTIGSASIPVRIGTGEEPQFDVNFQGNPGDEIHHAFVHKAEGTLYIETESIVLVAIANAAKLILGGGFVYVFYLLRQIVRAINAGEPFTVDTSRCVRRLGMTTLLLSFLVPVAQYIAASEILNRLPATVPELMPGPTFDVGFLFLSLLILLLAYVWSYGLDLERERELTV